MPSPFVNHQALTIMADNTIDNHIKAYADLFVAKFDSIAGDWRKPWLPTLPFSSQNAAGHLYSGVNDVNLSLMGALKGYSVPVWLTSGQCRDLGIMRLKGEMGTSVFWGGTSFIDKNTGSPDSEMRWAEYQKLSPAEKNRYSLRESNGNCSYVWNIEQTDFPTRHPDTWANLKAAFQRPSEGLNESTLDAFLEHGGWYPDDCHHCAIIQTDEDIAQYNRSLGCIEIPAKEKFSNPWEFYNTLLHEMAHSVIIEAAYANAKGNANPLEDIARLNLASELAAAVVAGRLGLSQTLSESSLQYLKQWSQILSEDPNVIRQVTREARVAVQQMTSHLGISQKEAPDVCATLGEQIRQAQSNRVSRSESTRRVHAETYARTGKPRLRKGRSAHL